MGVNIRLDDDLRRRLLRKVSEAGLVWETMPVALQFRYIRPYLRRQLGREERIVQEACRAA